MIENLRIKNFALIDKLQMDFSPGFNVITGETGAGKTIIMQAINLLMGERASKEILRQDSNECEICAEIKLNEKIIKKLSFLQEIGISYDDKSLILRRIITTSSSKNYLNDTPVSLQTLKTLGEILIDTHGPHEHQSLLKQSVQLELLDNYANLNELCEKTFKSYQVWNDAIKEKEEFEKDIPDGKEEEFLRYIINEIRTAELRENEEDEILLKHKILTNAQDIISAVNNSVKILSDSEESILEKIFELNRILTTIEKSDPEKSAEFFQDTESIRTKITELTDKLLNYSAKLELDERELVQIEERLRIINSLKRKYGNDIMAILKTAEEAEQKLEKIKNTSILREKLLAKIAKAKEDFEKAATELRKQRKHFSALFAKAIEKELEKLGFLKSRFSIDFYESEAGPTGFDRIDFMFSANPGEPLKPLRNIASSGEISRVMLALKTVLASADSVPILIFDEIDSNIGGTTAGIVGSELAKLAKTHQLICISHLPQVASEAETHFTVEKISKNNKTFTKIEKICGEKRIAEIARMLGGTDAALMHAKELLRKQK
ncbi:MAG TPA: DNA repair protein RecN [Victivallales bacterium]|nr:DNA repair protein RecN [Victivallales bacterium]HRU00453.1 DNA repair protein RecN [Victivallales bacterium]